LPPKTYAADESQIDWKRNNWAGSQNDQVDIRAVFRYTKFCRARRGGSGAL